MLWYKFYFIGDEMTLIKLRKLWFTNGTKKINSEQRTTFLYLIIFKCYTEVKRENRIALIELYIVTDEKYVSHEVKTVD